MSHPCCWAWCLYLSKDVFRRGLSKAMSSRLSWTRWKPLPICVCTHSTPAPASHTAMYRQAYVHWFTQNTVLEQHSAAPTPSPSPSRPPLTPQLPPPLPPPVTQTLPLPVTRPLPPPLLPPLPAGGGGNDSGGDSSSSTGSSNSSCSSSITSSSSNVYMYLEMSRSRLGHT